MVMQIMFITEQGDISGATNAIFYTAKGLAERGHSIFVACRKESLLYKMLEKTTVNLIDIKIKGKFDHELLKKLAKIIKEKNIQIVNAQSSDDRYLSIFLKWFYKADIKVIHTRRQPPLSCGGIIQNLFYKLGTDKIITVSEELKRIFVSQGYPENHLQAVYDGISWDVFDNVSSEKTGELRKKLAIDENDIIIGCVSRLKKQEDIFKALQIKKINAKLLFIGIKREEILDLINKYRIQNEVICVGEVSREEVMNYYRLFDVCILPSTTEGLGLVLIEAMALGVPVIGTKAGGIIDVIENNVSGYHYKENDYEELAEKIEALLEKSEKRNSIIENGLIRSKKLFSLEESLDNYEKCFAQVLEGKRK